MAEQLDAKIEYATEARDGARFALTPPALLDALLAVDTSALEIARIEVRRREMFWTADHVDKAVIALRALRAAMERGE